MPKIVYDKFKIHEYVPPEWNHLDPEEIPKASMDCEKHVINIFGFGFSNDIDYNDVNDFIYTINHEILHDILKRIFGGHIYEYHFPFYFGLDLITNKIYVKWFGNRYTYTWDRKPYTAKMISKKLKLT
jgi:hypothetical protein